MIAHFTKSFDELVDSVKAYVSDRVQQAAKADVPHHGNPIKSTTTEVATGHSL